MNRSTWTLCVVMGLAFAVATPAWALDNHGIYDQATRVGPDAQTGGWYINLGITGAQGKIMPDTPTVMEVAYVFKDTPADGQLMVGDRIVGVNGKPFTIPHKFGYGMDKFGYEGPMMDIGNALEESQGPTLNGKLTFDVIRDGQNKQIALKLTTKYGQFSKTYPYDCKKTDIILDELYAYLIERQRDNGAWLNGRPHINMFAALALLASGDEQYMPAVERAMRYFAEQTNDKIDYGGFDCWKQGLYGVCLAEYYLATGEQWVLPELEEINRWLLKAQFKDNYRNNKGAGGWGHRPSLRPGGNGYGPICLITAQAMTAWSLIAQCGIEVDRERYVAAHDFLMRGTNNIGYVWYADDSGGDDKYADMGRTGCFAVAHAVSPLALGGQAFRDDARKAAQCIGTNYNTFPDTHGSAILGMGWSALGAAADPASLRNLMDQYVWHFNLAQCPEGTFYFQPNRDPNTQDYNADGRLSASAAAALIFSIKHKSLLITGKKAP